MAATDVDDYVLVAETIKTTAIVGLYPADKSAATLKVGDQVARGSLRTLNAEDREKCAMRLRGYKIPTDDHTLPIYQLALDKESLVCYIALVPGVTAPTN